MFKIHMGKIFNYEVLPGNRNMGYFKQIYHVNKSLREKLTTLGKNYFRMNKFEFVIRKL